MALLASLVLISCSDTPTQSAESLDSPSSNSAVGDDGSATSLVPVSSVPPTATFEDESTDVDLVNSVLTVTDLGVILTDGLVKGQQTYFGGVIVENFSGEDIVVHSVDVAPVPDSPTEILEVWHRVRDNPLPEEGAASVPDFVTPVGSGFVIEASERPDPADGTRSKSAVRLGVVVTYGGSDRESLGPMMVTYSVGQSSSRLRTIVQAEAGGVICGTRFPVATGECR